MLKKIYKELLEIRKELRAIKRMVEFMPKVKLFRKPYSAEVHAIINIPDKDECVFMKTYNKDECRTETMIRHDSVQSPLNTYCGYDSQMYEI